MAGLPSKKVDHIALTRDYMAKKDVILTKGNIVWITERFVHYLLDVLIHGYVFTLAGKLKFWMYYVNSSDFKAIDEEFKYARSGAIHGVFFSIECSGQIPDQYKTEFKPQPKFRKMMEEKLDDPDLAYKLIT